MGFRFKASLEPVCDPASKEKTRKIPWVKVLAAKLEDQFLGHKRWEGKTDTSQLSWWPLVVYGTCVPPLPPEAGMNTQNVNTN